jgi:hypothetical protein
MCGSSHKVAKSNTFSKNHLRRSTLSATPCIVIMAHSVWDDIDNLFCSGFVEVRILSRTGQLGLFQLS